MMFAERIVEDLGEVASDGYTAGTLIEENFRDNKDFDKIINDKKPGRVRRLIYLALAPDKPADSLLIPETQGIILDAKKNTRRLQALNISRDQEDWLNDIINLYEKAIENNAEALKKLKDLCAKLTRWQTTSNSANVSQVVGVLGQGVQEIGAQVLMEFSTELGAHGMAFVASHGASALASVLKLGFKLGVFVKKKRLKKEIKHQEKEKQESIR